MTAPRCEYLADGVAVWLGDCRDVLPLVGKVDAVVTDPPYSVSLKGSSGQWTKKGNGGTRKLSFFEGDDDWSAMTGLVSDAIRSSISSGPHSVYVWCGHRQIGAITEQLEAAGYSTRFIVWKKTCPAPAPPGSGYMSAAEICLYGYRAGRPFRSGQVSNVIEADSYRFGQPGKVDHPTQKPLKTIEPFIRTSTRDDDVVLDPFMGSGTTGVACVQLGRKFVGIEIEPKYFDIACRRIADELRRPRLAFEAPAPKPVQEALI
jgi:site-specific DNA-methyltransferase (adenine-specific)